MNEMTDILDMVSSSCKAQFNRDLQVVLIETDPSGDSQYGVYQKAIKAIQKRKDEATVVCVTLPDGVELLRYPYFDVEFRKQPGRLKIGVTGKPAKIAKLMNSVDPKYEVK